MGGCDVAHTIEQVRNLALTGHSGAGKTCVAEAMLFSAGKLSRLGRIEDGTTLSDYGPEEIERQISLSLSVLTATWDDHYLSIIDTPGYADFMPEAQSALRVVDASIVVVESTSGVDVGTERVWGYAADRRVPRLVLINKMDRLGADFEKVVGELSVRLGAEPLLLQMPMGEGETFVGQIDLITRKAYVYNASDVGAERALGSQAV